MNSNYVLYTDEERELIDEMQMETNKKLFYEEGYGQGVEQGIEQGVEQGEIKKQNEMIKNMLNKNISLELISEVSNKPVKEIKEMATALKSI